ncbi:MAG: tetratricopeptide repeat protein [bacterium]
MSKKKCKFALLILPFIMLSELAAQSPADYLEQGNQFAKLFDNTRALDMYKNALTVDTSNCTALWRIAESYINLGEEADKKTCVQYFYVAEKWARKAVANCPQTANGYFFVAISSGYLALHEQGKQKIKRSKEVKENAEKTLELEPNHHGAYHVLGRWHQELTSLNWFLKALAKIVYGGVPPGASYDAAVENFKKAIKIAPEWINHHKQLGITYMKMGNWQLAKREFETVLELPIVDHQDEHHKNVCRKLLKKLENKS